jgi:hypothetical protein
MGKTLPMQGIGMEMPCMIPEDVGRSRHLKNKNSDGEM